MSTYEHYLFFIPLINIPPTTIRQAFSQPKIFKSLSGKVAEIRRGLDASVNHLTSGLAADWTCGLADTLRSSKIHQLAQFLVSERVGRIPIFPPADQANLFFYFCRYNTDLIISSTFMHAYSLISLLCIKVFSWSQLTPIDSVRVVLLGQDPYHGPGQAHGLAFSVRRPKPSPPSLINMYKELVSSLPADGGDSTIWPPNHGDLTNWARQGVLLLNAVLTVRSGQPNSHQNKGWEVLTDAVVAHLNKMRSLLPIRNKTGACAPTVQSIMISLACLRNGRRSMVVS
ncbi:unnamed protein product [Protopolystoma xenopodis]|uniref:Uracil-DNA glycosylase-like domain-containing protein n=1 Tax=Protopolystoma xenopodis TaxID=117903 RepID=A0A448XDH4_9PLAT|nr:unnamed protein product [Protopolystoma xenopodis]